MKDNKIVIAIVEDEESLRDLFKDFLESKNIKLYFCTGDPKKECPFHAGYPEGVDLIIRDFHIPCMHKACINLAKMNSIPIIHISGDEEAVEDYNKMGEDVLIKPFELNFLYNTIMDLIM